METWPLSLAASAAVGTSLAFAGFALARIPPVLRPTFGHRGVERARALAAGGAFRSIEPFIRQVAGWLRASPLGGSRSRAAKETSRLAQAGDFLGLDALELQALGVLGAGVVGGGALAIGVLLELGWIWGVFGGLIGWFLPSQRVGQVIQQRQQAIERGLPAAIDLAALCMGAGVDFPGALKLIVSTSRDAVSEELSRILEEVELGHTRREALESFQARAPREAVIEFVQAVVQAEEKGNPLAEVLRIQAEVMRSRRSVRAEEAAARAGVLMMLPLLLLLCCILLVLFGPFIVDGF